MASVQPVPQETDPFVSIQLHGYVEQIWRNALALRYRPCVLVSEKCLMW